MKAEFKTNIRGEMTTNSYAPTGEIGGIVSTIETTLTNFKNYEAIAVLNDLILPSILMQCIAQNNIEFFDELMKYDKESNAGLLLQLNDDKQNVFHMIGLNNNSEYICEAIVKRKGLMIAF